MSTNNILGASARWLALVALAACLTFTGCDDATEDPVEDTTVADMEEDTSTTDPTDTTTSEPDVEEETTDPFADSDNDGLADYLEDKNGNGVVDPGETDPNNADTDNDGLVDGLEDANQNGINDIGETDPLDEDTDDDELIDGVEDANANGVHDVEDGETNPLAADSDEDGLSDLIETQSELDLDPNNDDTDSDNIPDGVEDMNASGTYDPELNETDPTNDDTDMDGQSDGCEDRNTNGMVDLGETDPRRADSDGDGLVDGIECMPLPEGACPNYDNVGNCPTDPTKADTDGDGLSDLVELRSDYGGGIGTDPRKADTDNDGVPDGIEDFNQNGSYDPQLAELNPIEPQTDGSTPDALRPQAQACLSQDLPSVVESTTGNFQFAFDVALSSVELSFGTASDIGGFALDNPMDGAISAFVVAKPASPGATDAESQQDIDGVAIGGTSFFPREFTTWDQFEASTTTYRVTKSDTVGGLRNEVLSKVSGVSEGAIANLPLGTGGMSASAFEVTITTVWRDATNVVVIGAIAPQSPPDAAQARALSLTSATGLARVGDMINQNDDGTPLKACNIFRVTELPIVDFLFVIDDTGSMGQEQEALSSATVALFDAVQSAFISARWTINSTEATDDSGIDSAATHCGLLNAPKGPNGNPWAPFTGAYEQAFQCKVADPDGIQPCPVPSEDFPGFNEYGLVCSKWAIDYFQGRRGTFDPTHLQRPRSELIVVIISDEDADLVNGTNDIDGVEATALRQQFMMNQPLNGTTVGARFAQYYQVDASAPPYGRATPFLIYSKGGDDEGYFELIDGNPDPNAFPNSATLDIGGDLTEIPVFVEAVIRAANGLASTFEPLNVPITANMKVVVQRAFTTDAIEINQSQTNGWNYDPVARSMLFFGEDRPVLLDSFAINYAFWVPGAP